MILTVALAAVLVAEAQAVSVRVEPLGGQPAVRLTLPTATSAVAVRREKGEILVSVSDVVDPLPEMPAPVAPVTSLRAERRDGLLVVRIGLPEEVAHEIVRDGQLLSIRLVSAVDDSTPTTAELYRRILPVPLVETAEAEGGVEGGEEQSGGSAAQREAGHDLTIGRIVFRPSLNAGYVDDEVVLEDGAKTQREHHYEAEPRLRVTAPIGAGGLRLVYGPRFRWGSSVAVVNTTTHAADASLNLPLGRRLEVDATDHLSRGTLETSEVDPGNEYFYDLARFSRNQAGLAARLEVSAKLTLEASATAGRVRFARKGGYFDHDTRGMSLRLHREVTPNLRVGAGVRYDEVDSSQRPLAVMHATTAEAILRGDLAPRTRGAITVGFTSRQNPNAPPEGRQYRGLTARVEVSRDITRAATLRLSGVRETNASGFDNNGYYVTTAGRLDLTLPLPLGLSFRGGTGYHLNGYRVASTAIGAPREDRIFTWSLGVGRALGRWGYWRVDYRMDRRDSNINEFDHDAHSLVVRLGVGLFEEAQPR